MAILPAGHLDLGTIRVDADTGMQNMFAVSATRRTIFQGEKRRSPAKRLLKSTFEPWGKDRYRGLSSNLLFWRQKGAKLVTMKDDSKDDNRTRRNLRLPPELCEAVDAACEKRAGKVSFNTWIIEAVEEKLARSSGNDNLIATQEGKRRA